jgi:hypothetical protein
MYGFLSVSPENVGKQIDFSLSSSFQRRLQMKQLLTILLLCSFSLVQAQITIDSDDMPEVNDTIRVSETFLGALDPSDYLQNGENVNWNFENLTPTSQTVRDYERAINTPYGVFFLGFNRYGVKQFDSLGVAQFQFRNIYQYFRSNNRDFRVEGLGFNFQGVPLPAYFSDEDELYQFPLDYSDRDSSTFAFNLAIPAVGSYESTGYRINRVDGWGTITTPFGTFNCIRLVSEVVANDSIEAAGIKLGLRNVRRSYQWLAKDIKVPVLEIEGNVIAGNFVPIRTRYRDEFRAVRPPVPDSVRLLVDFVANNRMPTTRDTVQLTSISVPTDEHQWIISPGTYQFVDGTTDETPNPRVVFHEAGSYDVELQIRNRFGSGDTTKVAFIEVIPFSNIARFEQNELTINIYPNPTQDYLFIEVLDETDIQIGQLQLWNTQGQLVWQEKGQRGGQHTYSLMFPKLVAGTYFLHLESDKGTIVRSIHIQ